MQLIGRRTFLKRSAAVAVSAALLGGRVLGVNGDIRVGIIGVGRNGTHMARRIARMPGVRLIALADPDPAYQMQSLKEQLSADEPATSVDTYVDFRRLLDRRDIDAVIVASCNHWHVLHAIYTLQAEKHLYVEKPLSHSVWEGRQLVRLAGHSKQVIETGIHHRSRECWPQVMDYLRTGQLGRVLTARGLCYRLRNPIGKRPAALTPPSSCDYDLWLGPAADEPILRSEFHYDWHWVWNTGNGELGNQGVHQLDICRWLIGQQGYPKHILSLGGRFAIDDAGQSPNTQVVYFDYAPVPLIFEVRNLPVEPGIQGEPIFKHTRIGSILECEDGFIAESAAYDRQGRRIAQFDDLGGGNHLVNFFEAVRSNRPDRVSCPIEEAHLSSALCHFGNISHRIGQDASAGQIAERIKGNPLLDDAWRRCCDNLTLHGVEPDDPKAVLGAMLSIDGEAEKVQGEFAEAANPLLRRDGRGAWTVPETPPRQTAASASA